MHEDAENSAGPDELMRQLITSARGVTFDRWQIETLIARLPTSTAANPTPDRDDASVLELIRRRFEENPGIFSKDLRNMVYGDFKGIIPINDIGRTIAGLKLFKQGRPKKLARQFTP